MLGRSRGRAWIAIYCILAMRQGCTRRQHTGLIKLAQTLHVQHRPADCSCRVSAPTPTHLLALQNREEGLGVDCCARVVLRPGATGVSCAGQPAKHALQLQALTSHSKPQCSRVLSTPRQLRVPTHRLDASGYILAAWLVEYLAGIRVEGVVDQVVLDL